MEHHTKPWGALLCLIRVLGSFVDGHIEHWLGSVNIPPSSSPRSGRSTRSIHRHEAFIRHLTCPARRRQYGRQKTTCPHEYLRRKLVMEQ
ncbi:hypothetical protein B0J15DRAFT_502992 [Fusarium solani]|uniref:Secreted protein n=1 Tax=Fusarium solani TaxID=169388 RepID=A0A9P9GH07_FUSSL|nr:uncharacterized protein B0J15DRAFT_506773 [Fusarium solani]XP_046125806.1 uncharacterized protein B0J15DRAFT_502992 [Fusarium solani]KAH7221778.1 hypothetical protein B0J15DRAFT_506773 [Fusarium solani]KAH7237834.1 hypothetical protein B0J15DRAFT_502992 [Fusarium solani]